jgi:hypothetical protein
MTFPCRLSWIAASTRRRGGLGARRCLAASPRLHWQKPKALESRLSPRWRVQCTSRSVMQFEDGECVPRAGRSTRRSTPHTIGRQMSELRTPRLLLRQWRDADLEPFAALNADEEVMRYFPAPLARSESDALAEGQGIMMRIRGGDCGLLKS